ncbi:chromosome segregation protein SMC [Metallumcola ferriviriculae]|uniref:Chromosome partition protein Smc n=1 Tax=Metallumcola ferriviriculae TaxID=3039180 RepID=A0AAU0UPS8_9FIRM|nr:chromosome segregation protein SMC [Desulfitibacteraceae bacterium MK1]
MYLKQLQIKGFKSFANKTIMEFSPGITAVVGPNGSGKSNIADAVRWVLGEQSARSLRGNKMEDVIFAGSKERKPVGMAQVSLVLNNEDGNLPLDFNEVDITRRVFRSGESEFLINKTPCRLKDIHELFMDSGVGKESFSIIGQGKVEEILNSKPEDRRSLLEEAAGISKYRYRQQQAAKKLDRTEQSIERLQDLVQEIESQLGPLGEQASRAEQYQSLKSKHDKLEIKGAVVEIGKLQEKLDQTGQQREQLLLEVKEGEAQNNLMEADLEQNKLNLKQLEEKISEIQQRLYRQEQELQHLEASMGIEKEKRQNGSQRIDQLSQEKERLQEKKGRLEELIAGIREKQQGIADQLKKVFSEVTETENNYQQLIDQFSTGAVNAENLKNEIFDMLHKESSVKNELARQDQNRRNYGVQEQRFLKQRSELQNKLTEKKKALADIEERMASEGKKVDNFRQKLMDLDEIIVTLGRELEQQELQRRQVEIEISKKANRLEALQGLSKGYDGFYRGVRKVLQAHEKQQQGLTGICGAVAQLFVVPERYELAIETALGAAAQNIVVNNDTDAQSAIQFLKSNNSGRATFLPLDTVRPRLLSGKLSGIVSMAGIIGVAKDLANAPERYQPILDHLLGSVIIAEDMRSAVTAARKYGFKMKIVTLEGEVVNAGGAMTGGSSSPKESGLIRREGEINRLQKSLGKLQGQFKQINDQMIREQQKLAGFNGQETELKELIEERLKEQDILERSAVTLTKEIDNLVEVSTGLEWEEAQLSEDLSSIEAQETELKEKLSRLEQQRTSKEQDLASLTEANRNLESRKSTISEIITGKKVKMAALEQQEQSVNNDINQQERLLNDVIVDMAAKNSESERLVQQNQLINQKLENFSKESKELALLLEKLHEAELGLKEQKNECKINIEQLEETIKFNNKSLQQQQIELNQKEIKLAKWETEKENYCARLWENHQMSYEQALLDQDDELEVRGLTTRLRSLRQEMQALGTVNIGAIEEYQRVSERYEFLTKQLSDLREAKNSLNKVIFEMQSIMKARFGKTFNRVNQYFTEMFSTMFGGGTAELRLTEAEDVLEAGIDIIAQPPGKKLSHLSLLSGGEKALTAIALLFAILKYRPSPFCLLDEIDASLDETNVDRFTDVLKGFAVNTQFIVISHRQGTMEGADDLYGVTMENTGTSKLVSVKLERSGRVS